MGSSYLISGASAPRLFGGSAPGPRGFRGFPPRDPLFHDDQRGGGGPLFGFTPRGCINGRKEFTHMKLPSIRYAGSQGRSYQVRFGGYNHTLAAGEGSCGTWAT